MNIKIIIGSSMAAAFLLIGTISAQATVGGPTYIGNFSYNKSDESVYFIWLSQSGRGCPPEFSKISLVNENVDSVINCDAAEKISAADPANGAFAVLNKINDLTTNHRDLVPISLPKNNIAIDIQYKNADYMEGWGNDPVRRNFTAVVYQNGTRIDEFPIAGCTMDQPFTFAGYAIPTLEKKIVLLVSGKSDCFEGGYTGESLKVVGGINSLDKTPVNFFKSYEEPLVPSEATLVVTEREKVETAPVVTPSATTSNSTENSNNSTRTPTIIIIILLALILGTIIGKFSSNKSK